MTMWNVCPYIWKTRYVLSLTSELPPASHFTCRWGLVWSRAVRTHSITRARNMWCRVRSCQALPAAHRMSTLAHTMLGWWCVFVKNWKHICLALTHLSINRARLRQAWMVSECRGFNGFGHNQKTSCLVLCPCADDEMKWNGSEVQDRPYVCSTTAANQSVVMCMSTYLVSVQMPTHRRKLMDRPAHSHTPGALIRCDLKLKYRADLSGKSTSVSKSNEVIWEKSE